MTSSSWRKTKRTLTRRIIATTAQQIAFRIPEASIGYWTNRFIEQGVAHETLKRRFNEPVISFVDPDGMTLVGTADAERGPGWSAGHIPVEHGIRGFRGVTLMLDDGMPTAAVLRDVLGFKDVGTDSSINQVRASEAIGGIVDIREAKGFLVGGSVVVPYTTSHFARRMTRTSRDVTETYRQPRPASDRPA